MTEIVTENNFSRRRRVRPSRALPWSEWKVVKRHRLGANLLALFCAENLVSADDLQSRSQASRLVALRRRFARICHSNKVGRKIVGNLLCRDQSTIAAYLSDKIVRDKVERKRRERESRKSSLRHIENYETVSI